jgi:hypothetical protein
MTAWWSDQTAALCGGIAGGAVGLLGAVIGTLGGVCAPRGRCKRLVYSLLAVAVCAGVIALAAGILALAAHQPYAVWYPLVLIGGVETALFGGLTPLFRLRYRQADQRRLEAEELRRG